MIVALNGCFAGHPLAAGPDVPVGTGQLRQGAAAAEQGGNVAACPRVGDGFVHVAAHLGERGQIIFEEGVCLFDGDANVRMARNTPIQGTAADVIKLAMVRVWRRLRDEKMESRLILTVHDELIVEAPEAEAEKAAGILREEMEGCVQYAVPLSTDVHTGKNWLEAH